MGSGRTGSSPNKAGSRVPTEQSRGMRRSSGNTGRLAFHGAPGDRDRPRVGRNASGGAASGDPPSQLVWVRGARVRERLLGTRRCKALLTGGFPRGPWGHRHGHGGTRRRCWRGRCVRRAGATRLSGGSRYQSIWGQQAWSRRGGPMGKIDTRSGFGGKKSIELTKEKGEAQISKSGTRRALPGTSQEQRAS